MLLTHAKFSEFTSKRIVDAGVSAEAILALTVDRRAEVDRLASAALKAGGIEPSAPKDYGFMVQRAFADPDGHNWEVIHMDPAHVLSA